MTINGLNVLSIRPVFDHVPKMTAKIGTAMFGVSSAPRVVGYIGARPLHAFSHDYALKSRAEIDELRDHFFDMKGRWGEFYVPSWHQELQPLSSLLHDQTSFTIDGVSYKDVYGFDLQSTGRNLFFLSDVGNMFAGRVTNSIGSGIETLSLNSAPEQDFILGHFLLGFLYRVRLASDTLTLKFSGINEATATLSFVEVIDPYED